MLSVMGYHAHQTALESTTLEKSNLLSKIATLELKQQNPPLNVNKNSTGYFWSAQCFIFHYSPVRTYLYVYTIVL